MDNFNLTDFWEDSDYARKEYVGAPVTDEMIQSVQAELGYRLPKAYIELLRSQNGGRKWVFQPLNKKGRAEATLERAARAIEELGENDEFLMVYYGTDGAGGWQTLDRPLRTITTLDRFALVRPNCKGHEMRMLQPPELAAAMGFPVDYRWPNTARRNKIKMIGNAVCPPVMQAIVSHLIVK